MITWDSCTAAAVARLLGGSLLAGLLTAGAGIATATPAQAALGPAPGTVARPISRLHLENFEWFNILQVVDADNRIVRIIKIAGNPLIPKPDVCWTSGRIRVNWDYSLTWRLNYFTRLCTGRGMGTHDIPINRYSGRRSMNAVDLGKAPFHGAPLSHGCLRMAAVDAEYVYDHLSNHVPVYFIRTPWRKAGPTPPSAVTALHASAADQQASFSWAAPALHGSALTGFVVTLSPGGVRQTLPATARTATFTGLVNGTRYAVSVVPTSALGAGPPSGSPGTVPFGLPGAPATVTALHGPPGVAIVAWTAAAPNGASVTSYLVSVDGLPAVRVPPFPAQTLVRGVPSGGPLHVEVAAVNAAGAGTAAVVDGP
jgi:Fibronectin type III domain